MPSGQAPGQVRTAWLPTGQVLGQVLGKDHNFDYDVSVVKTLATICMLSPLECGVCVADFEGNCRWSRLIDVGGGVAAELGALGSKPSSVKSAHSSVLFMRWCLCLRLCASVAGVLDSFARQTGVSWLSEHADTWFTPAVDFGGEDNVCAGITAEAGSRRHRGHRRLIPN